MMLADYAKEPYLVLPILAGLLPRDATKHSHREDRDRYKPMVLAVQYGGGSALLARRLGLTAVQGQRIVNLHRDRYEAYWDWSDRKLQRAFEDGELVARDGWRCGINSLSSIFTARNWLIQSDAAAIFRYAGLLMRCLHLRVIALVHDAVLLEVDLDQLEHVQALAVECLERASRRFLHGLTLRVDAKCVLPGERFADERGAKTWEFVEQSLRELAEGRRRAG
jgi:DNA polymerase I-like protein with 3'-5' exonuclease and polymerase domains